MKQVDTCMIVFLCEKYIAKRNHDTNIYFE